MRVGNAEFSTDLVPRFWFKPSPEERTIMNIFLRVLRSQQKHQALISVLISALTFSIGYAEPKTGFRYQVEEVNHVSQTKTTVLVPKSFG